MAYVMILLILVISVSLALSFLLRVGTETEAAMSRSAGMQVEYLAESAAGHAKWLLLNDPTFPADEDTYYMHSFAGGRYGYKVRRHTATTFATISTVGVLGDHVVQQSYVLYVIQEIPGLLGWWELDQNSGTVALDSSSAGNDGTLTNMAGDEWSTGMKSGALCFDGNNDYVDIGSVDGTVKSIAFWMKDDTPFVPLDTGFHSPSDDSDDFDQWNNPDEAYTSNNNRATQDDNGDEQDWFDFDLGVPGGMIINGIEVEIEGRTEHWWDPTGVDVELSWDSGASYTSTGYGYVTSNQSDVVRTFGGTNDEWGRTWSTSDFDNSNFRLRLDKRGSDGDAHEVDHIQVKIYYSAPITSKVIDLNGSDYIEIDTGNVTPISFPGTTTIYVDGLVGSAVSTAWHHVVVTDTVGISATDLLLGRVSGNFFDGCLDDVRLYDRILTHEEIDELSAYRAPIAFWKLDESAGVLASDFSGHGNDGTLTNMNPGTDWVSGHIDGALDFDGNNDVVVVPHDDALSLTGDCTFAAWVKSNGFAGLDCIVGKGDSGTTWNYFFGTTGNQVIFEFYDGGWVDINGGPNLSTGVWYHLAATFEPDNDLVRLFVDGVEVHSETTTRNTIANTEDVIIGSDPWGEDWNGMLDDVRVYARILSDAEIAALAGM